MMTDQTTVTSIGLRSDEDGSWMRTSEDTGGSNPLQFIPKYYLITRGIKCKIVSR
jgi:hypothetical protein